LLEKLEAGGSHQDGKKWAQKLKEGEVLTTLAEGRGAAYSEKEVRNSIGKTFCPKMKM